MGLYSAFYASLSGLSSNASALNVIGNNLSNINTIGFKGSAATFQDLFAASLGASATQGNGNPSQIGLGTRLASVFQNFGQGSFQSTSNVTDMAIQGQGFFTLNLKGGGRAYSRAGNFTLDKYGNMVDPNGNGVLGWNRAASGTVNTSGSIVPINIPVGITSAPTATTQFGFVTNLDSSAPMGTQFTSSQQIYDSQGQTHNVLITYTKTAANTWNWSLGTDLPGATLSNNTGTLTFDNNGTLLTPVADPTSIGIVWNNGAAGSSLSWDLWTVPPVAGPPAVPGQATISQLASASTTSNSNQNGFGAGSIRSLTVDQNGIITGAFTNGQTMALAQVAVAMFSNYNGLQKGGDSTFTETLASGPASIGIPNAGGRGSILGSNLELSNVDIADEFTKLIINQRGYQANGKVVTTSDELLQETLNLKR